MGILEQTIEILGQIIGFFFAYHLLRLAYKLFSKKQFMSAAMVSWASAFVLLCSLHWFQVWAKSFIATNVTSNLTSFGQQLKTVQATTTEIYNRMATHQMAIDQQQQTLTEVQTNLWNTTTNLNTVLAATTEMHSQLAGHQTMIDQQQQALTLVQGKVQDAETGFSDQQLQFTTSYSKFYHSNPNWRLPRRIFPPSKKKLSEVESWIKNLYGVMTNDATRNQTTNSFR